MTYIKRSDITTCADETVVELDTGALVATGCVRERVAAGIAFRAWARAIHADGNPVLDALGRPVDTTFSHLAAPAIVDMQGADTIARDCMLAVLGEPVGRPWADVLLSSVSIRISLLAAQITGPVDAGGVL